MAKWGLLFFLLLSMQAKAQLSRGEVDELFTVLHQIYDEDLKAQGAILRINHVLPDHWWAIDKTTAGYAYSREGDIDTHNIYVAGGYARLVGMTADGFMQLLCHELGHGIAGPPYKRPRQENVSVEGQADYFSTQSCLKKVFTVLSPSQPLLPLSPFVESLCKQETVDVAICYRGFQALEATRKFFHSLGQESSFERKDLSVVETVNVDNEYYPSTQCRLDSLVAGLLDQPRPTCWFTLIYE